MSYKGVNHESVIKFGYVAALGFAMALIAFFQPFARPEPANSHAYGCYVSTAASHIYLDQFGMTILQPGFARFPYHLERHKTAIALTADAPIQADRVGARYVYSLYHPGVGTFLDFTMLKVDESTVNLTTPI
ncbi:MAG: hypothetical protein EOO77_25105 [Oxalobacteraceae bacterium]|nr:MAG: hypothetical protein EOO77_25105 [Oxalobacteraceae bacterium]